MLKTYFIIITIILAAVALFEEATVKGTKLNIMIRHYFGMPFFVEYSANNPLNFPIEDEVAECDYRNMTSK